MKPFLNSAISRLTRFGTDKVLVIGFVVLAVIVMGRNHGSTSCGVPAISGMQLPSDKSAADFALADLSGKTVQLADYKGKVLLLDFWATWCPPCRREIPDLIQLQKEYANKGFSVLGVALDDQGASVVKPFAERMGINYPLVMGNAQVTSAYGGVESIPTTFLIGPDGKILKTYIGGREKTEFQKDIQKALLAAGNVSH